MGKTIRGWLGYNEGWGEIKGEKWRPYSPDNFLCPQFPSYVSGHSTVSAACAEALRLYTGSDEFGITVNVVAGSLTENEESPQELSLISSIMIFFLLSLSCSLKTSLTLTEKLTQPLKSL